MTTPPGNTARPNTLRLGIAAVIIAVVAAGAFGLWDIFLRPSGPAAVGDANVAIPTASAAPSTAAASASLAERATGAEPS